MEKVNNKGMTTKKLLIVIIIVAALIGFLFFYFYNQRRRNFVTQAKGYIDDLRELVTADEIFLPDTKEEKVMISVSQINPQEKLSKTPFGSELVVEKSYIIIKNNGTEYTPVYDYYVTLQDEKGFCIPLTKEKELNRSYVTKNCDIEPLEETGAIYLQG